MLKKMGWSEGKGLGKNEDGIQDCVQIARRPENLGLGGKTGNDFKWNDNWWDRAFDSTIKNLQIIVNEKDNHQSEISTNSDEEEAVVEAHHHKVSHKTEKKKKNEKIVKHVHEEHVKNGKNHHHHHHKKRKEEESEASSSDVDSDSEEEEDYHHKKPKKHEVDIHLNKRSKTIKKQSEPSLKLYSQLMKMLMKRLHQLLLKMVQCQRGFLRVWLRSSLLFMVFASSRIFYFTFASIQSSIFSSFFVIYLMGYLLVTQPLLFRFT
eukprot:TRINITY_DN1841_c0_g1_i3.p1 TRINITY_DN1841_c0_g1~~TRINITY_DN1841_c0_g1_i3.p1  ORF type:complete len:264 (-),score=39.58 TRINITY_DN1841_c0_g1_i3:154-945(-)